MVFSGLAEGFFLIYDYSRKKWQRQPQAISQEIKFKAHWSAICLCCCDDWLDVVLDVLMLRTKKTCAGGRLEVDLKQLASRPNQNQTTEETEAILTTKKTWLKKGA